MKHKFHVVLTLLLTVGQVQAQSVNKEELLKEVRTMQQSYLNNTDLSFDVKYVYATEKQPNKFLDSVIGNMEIQGNNYRLQLNNTETVKSGKLMIHVFNDDKLIYLSAPSNNTDISSPISLLDSTLSQMQNLNFHVERGVKNKTITINFPPGNNYKSIAFDADNITGFIIKTKYVVKSQELLEDKGLINGNNEPLDEYAIVEAYYFNYKKGQIDPASFDQRNYVLQIKNEYKPAEKFKDYSVFLGSTNL